MDIERGPIADALVVVWTYCDDADFWMRTKHTVAKCRTCFRVVERDEKKMGPSLVHAIQDIALFQNFSDDLYARLVRKRLEYQFAHQLGLVCYQDADGFLHALLPFGGSIRFLPKKGRLNDAAFKG